MKRIRLYYMIIIGICSISLLNTIRWLFSSEWSISGDDTLTLVFLVFGNIVGNVVCIVSLLSILSGNERVVVVPSNHGDLIDRKQITAMIRKQFCDKSCDRASVDCERCGVNMIIDEIIGKAPSVIEEESKEAE